MYVSLALSYPDYGPSSSVVATSNRLPTVRENTGVIDGNYRGPVVDFHEKATRRRHPHTSWDGGEGFERITRSLGNPDTSGQVHEIVVSNKIASTFNLATSPGRVHCCVNHQSGLRTYRGFLERR